VVSLTQAIPALPVRDAAAASAFYRDRLGFQVLHQHEGFAVLGRDDARVHLWQAGDESWRERGSLEETPVRSGAESFRMGRRVSRKRNDSSTTVQPGRVRGQSPDAAGTAASGRDGS
jgi:catechol 2,3-dioxygenase-like lactoylglutathione lyase family enzyme